MRGTKHRKGLNVRTKIATVELEFVGSAMKVIREFSKWCRQKLFELKKFRGKKIREWSGVNEESSELFTLENGVIALPMPPFLT